MCLSDDVESVEWDDEQQRVEPSSASPGPEDEGYHVGASRQFTLKAMLFLTFIVALSLGMIRWAEFTLSTYKFSMAMTGTADCGICPLTAIRVISAMFSVPNCPYSNPAQVTNIVDPIRFSRMYL